jgi:hypothetical protein
MKSATPQDTQDHMLGSGALTWSWWLKADVTGEDTPDWAVTLTCETGDESGTATAAISHAAVMTMARQVIRTRPQYATSETIENCRNLVFNADETDFDACSADQLLQMLVLGEIIFG